MLLLCRYSLLLLCDPGKPKGTAFVKFKNKDSVRLIMDEEKKVSEQLGIMDVERNTKKRQRVHFSGSN